MEMKEDSTPVDGWQLDHDSPEAYERYLVPRMFAPWAERLIERAELRAGDRLLDVACGTGIVARRAAATVGERGSVVGVDVNDAMLRVAKEQSAGLPDFVEWRQGDATDLPFPEGAFEVVCCQQALQFIPDRMTALSEMHRVLTTTGQLAVSVWRPIAHNPAYVVMADALERHVGAEAADMMRSPFPEWGRTELRGQLEDAGFHDTDLTIDIGSMRYPSVEAFLRREAASSPLAEPLGALDRPVRRVLLADLQEGLEPYTDDHGVVFPMEALVAVARR